MVLDIKKQFEKMVHVKVNNGIIELTFLKSPKNTEGETLLAHVVNEKIGDVLKKNSKKNMTLLVNLLKVGDTGSPTSEARKVYAKMGGNLQLKKVAVCGNSVRLKVVANFIARLTGRKEFKWFSVLGEAKKWLQT